MNKQAIGENNHTQNPVSFHETQLIFVFGRIKNGIFQQIFLISITIPFIAHVKVAISSGT